MRLIGAGLPRTGTLSQKLALEMLGLAPCYHMVTVMADLEQATLWERAADGDVVWDEILGDFQSTVDWPGGLFYKELMEAYPDAKVLLSTRDPEAWERSMRQTVWAVRHGGSLMRLVSDAQVLVNPLWAGFISMIDRIVWDETFKNRDSPEQMIETFERHNEEVRATVPPERLLEWEVSEGWEPLCEFLELPVPDMPFPHINDSTEFVNRVIDGSLLALNEWRAKDSPIPADVAAEH
jgi:Sulfotransferase domain